MSFNLYGPINHLGFGVHFSNWAGRFIGRVAQRGHECFVFPKGHTQFSSKERLSMVDQALYGSMRMNHGYSAASPAICLWQPLNTAEFCGHPRIFYTVWEGSRLRPQEAASLEQVDAIWVPTQWHKDIIDNVYELPPCYVVPEGVNEQIFHHGTTGQMTRYSRVEDNLKKMTTFVSVGKLEKRKGMEVALDALIAAAAERRDHVFRLFGHWWNPFIEPERGRPGFFAVLEQFMWSRDFRAEVQEDNSIVQRHTSKEHPNVIVDVIMGPLPKQTDLIEVYRTGDWGLFPHSAEGWGLPLHESMACGLPPITQYYSGPTQYLAEGSFIGAPGTLVQARDNLHFKDGQAGMWSQVNTDALARAVLTAIDMDRLEREVMCKAASAAAHQYTWDKAVTTSIEVLEEMRIL